MRLALALLGVAAALPTAGPALAQQPEPVGVTAAARPLTQGSMQGGSQLLRIGNNVFNRETVRTSASGRAQLLFLDETRLSIAPSSEVVLYSYVYDQASRTGRLQASLGPGMVQAKAGDLGNRPGSIQLPIANTANRIELGPGAVAQVTVGATGDATVASAANAPITVVTPREQATIVRENFFTNVTTNGDISPPTRGSPERAVEFNKAMFSGTGGTGEFAPPGTLRTLSGQLSSLPPFALPPVRPFRQETALSATELDVLAGLRLGRIGDIVQDQVIRQLTPPTPPVPTPPTPSAPTRPTLPTPATAPTPPAAPVFPARQPGLPLQAPPTVPTVPTPSSVLTPPAAPAAPVYNRPVVVGPSVAPSLQ